jgi:hypothetical protein
MDRTNHSNAISDNLPHDLAFTINVVNTGTAICSVLFSVFCLSGAVVAKRVGPARCKQYKLDVLFYAHPYRSGIPILVFFWGLVTLTHALIKNKAEYLAGKLTIPL